jgi:hypothetical protein
MLVASVLAAGACGRLGYDHTANDAGAPQPDAIDCADCEDITVALPSAGLSLGASWNDYIVNDGLLPFATAGTECLPDFNASCTHAGELRVVEVSSVLQCGALFARDDLNAFRWECDDSTGSVYFYSTGLLPGRGLSTLLTASGFRDNAVTIFDDAQPIARSEASVWWQNPVVPLPPTEAEPIFLDGADDDGAGPDQAFLAGTIFVLDEDRETVGYQINMDHASLVVLENATLGYSAGPSNCWGSDECVVAAESQNHVWVEGQFDGEGGAIDSDNAVLFSDVRHSRIRRARVEHAQGSSAMGITISASHHNIVTDIKLADDSTSGGTALLVHNGASNNRFYRVHAAFTGNYGIYVHQTTRNNVFHQINVSNNDSHGIVFDNSDENTTTALLATNNSSFGVHVTSGSDRNTMSHATTANNGSSNPGFYLSGASFNTVSGVVSTNNAAGFMAAGGADDNLFRDIFVPNNNDFGLVLRQVFNNRFVGVIGLGQNDEDCDVVDGGGNNVAELTCSFDASGPTEINGMDLEGSFVGRALSDASNLHTDQMDVAGRADASIISDWTHFENPYRAWGPVVEEIALAIAHRRQCNSGNCAIWDWRIAADDSALRNRNGVFQTGQPCPASVHGDQAMTDLQSTPNTYLINALEVMEDLRGDEDGLCESGESCIFSPHVGAYQGEGGLRPAPCSFTNGQVSGVTMYGHAN